MRHEERKVALTARTPTPHGLLLLAPIIVAAVAGPVGSKLLWGYAFIEPKVGPSIAGARTIRHATVLSGVGKSAQFWDCNPGGEVAVMPSMPSEWRLPGMGEVLGALKDRGMEPRDSTYDARLDTGALFRQIAERGYQRAACGYGLAVEVEPGGAGARLIVAMYRPDLAQAGNDSYEKIYASFEPGDGGLWRLRTVEHYRYDFGNMEDLLTAPVISFAVLIILLLVLFVGWLAYCAGEFLVSWARR